MNVDGCLNFMLGFALAIVLITSSTKLVALPAIAVLLGGAYAIGARSREVDSRKQAASRTAAEQRDPDNVGGPR